jgi:outer membrane immunogenic protein
MKPLRSYLLATASSVALIGSAAAQPPVPPVMTWAGPYAGLNVGAAWNRSSFTDVDQFFFILGGPLNNNFWTNTNAGVTVGGLLGYNWQYSNIVYGVEGDLNWVNETSSASIPNSTAAIASSSLRWMSTARGRLGVTFDTANLFYVTGGVAFANFSDFWGAPTSGARFTMSSDFTRVGWTVGGGVERMFTPHWIGRIEALYSDFGTETTTDVDISGTYRSKFAHSVTQARGALSYKW